MASLSFGDNGLNNVTDLANSPLDGDITGSPATFTVDDGSRFPSANFTVLIDSEQIFISSRTSETLTVGARGAGSPATSSVDHSSGATVSLVLASEHIQGLADYAQPLSEGVEGDGSGNLTFKQASQDYVLEQGGNTNNLALTSQGAATAFNLDFFTADGDGTDNLNFNIYGVGGSGSITNRERMVLRYVAGTRNELVSESNGTGTTRPLHLYTGANTDQLVLATGGNVGIGDTAPNAPLDITGTPWTPGSGWQSVVNAYDDTAYAADVGAGITLGGKFNAAGSFTEFGQILGGKENGTDGNSAGYISFFSRASGAPLTEKMRIDSSGNVGIGTTSPDGSGITVDTALHIAESSGSSAVNVDSTTDSRIIFSESDVWKYNLSYSATNNRFVISSTDTDGGGTDADVIRIPDGQLTVDGNATFDDNAFDYVCINTDCNKNYTDKPTDESCVSCGSSVMWHDDADFLDELVHAKNITPELAKKAAAMGVMKFQEEEDGTMSRWVPMNRAPIYNFSAIAQQSKIVKAMMAKLEELAPGATSEIMARVQ